MATLVARRSNGSDGPIRKSGANHCGDGEGSFTSLSSGLWGPSPSRTVGQPGPPSPESPSVSTRDGCLRAAGTKCSSCQPRQPARGGGLQTQGAGKRGGEAGHRVRGQQRPHTVSGKRSSTEDRQRVQVYCPAQAARGGSRLFPVPPCSLHLRQIDLRRSEGLCWLVTLMALGGHGSGDPRARLPLPHLSLEFPSRPCGLPFPRDAFGNFSA